MSTTSTRLARRFIGAFAAVLVLSAGPAWAQAGPPIRGTIQPEPNKKKMYEGVGAAAVGVEKVVHAVAGNGDENGVFPGLREGSTVAVQEAAQAGGASASESPASTEAMITRIDRKQKRLIVRFETGRTEELQLVERSTGDTTPAPVTITYSDGEGGKVLLGLKRVS